MATPLPHAEARALASADIDTAWPTVALCGAVLGLTAATALGAVHLHWPTAVVVALLTLASYAMFTVMHEAVHGSVFRRRPWANALIGTLASPFMGPTASYTAYRTLHLQHHRHTNDPRTDPDHYSGAGPAWWLPLAWLTTDLHYYVCYLKLARTRPWTEAVRVTAENAALFGLLAALVWHGWAMEALWYWVLPSRLSTALLAWGFNYLPHSPYACLAEDDPYRATRTVWPHSRLATVLLQAHNFHQVHHLYPGIPFYRYARLWRQCAPELQTRGQRP